MHPEIRVAYMKIVTISTDNLLELNEMRDGLGAGWPFLSDPGRTIQKDLDIAEYTDPRHDPMIPHTLVLEPGLPDLLDATANGIGGRPSNEDLRRDLREVTRRIRPDWTRDAGLTGEVGSTASAMTTSWPYGRSMREVLSAWEA